MVQQSYSSRSHFDNTVLFIGSSTIRQFTDLESYFTEHHVVKNGFGGAKINDLHYYKEQLIFSHTPTLIVLYIGMNDILYRDYHSVQTLSKDLFRLIVEIQQRRPQTDIALVALRPIDKPRYKDAVKQFNQQLSKYADSDPNVHYIDANTALTTLQGTVNTGLIHWDGVHLNKQGYQVWGAALRQQLHDHHLLNH